MNTLSFLNNNFLLLILSGLSLFLFSLDQIKFNLNNLFISKLKKIISISVNTTLKSFLVGLIVSACIQSSSGTTAIAISLLSSNYIKPKNCLGIIIGANLGTCLTTFITAININNISLIILIISFITYIIIYKYRKITILFIYIGLMLLGLDILNIGFNNIINNNYIYNIIKTSQESTLLSVLFGIFSTAIIQSSSGIIGIVENMYDSNLINLSSSISIMLGANIGTTLTGYLATINTSNNTKTIINRNLLFNIIGVFLFILFLKPFIIYINNIQNKYFTNNLKLSIAYAHFIFNLITVILAYIFFNVLTININKKEWKPTLS